MASLDVLCVDITVLKTVQGTPATDPPQHQSHSQSQAGAQSAGKAAVPPELAALDFTDDATKNKPDPFLGFYLDVYRSVWEVESSRSIQLVMATSVLVGEFGNPRLADPGLTSVFEKGPLADGGSNTGY
ncbi:hypothetical protein M422DRAFT_259470 [Sphaerobolus stellatus SS14]|uniref:Uncharacterized protein n=1 Tax=Sphaerobolus stellatus (strain SS14) TaxID=990650 RepID=A0A0C9VKA1_SPHS4|nr:hypothetical protein M422DRAFT_259470 [Sphaerobolus stellatus SS14]